MKRALLVVLGAVLLVAVCAVCVELWKEYRFVDKRLGANAECHVVALEVSRAIGPSTPLPMSQEQVSAVLRQLDFGKYGNLVSLNADKLPVDGWGNPLGVTVSGKGATFCVEVRSAAQDGLLSTADDIVDTLWCKREVVPTGESGDTHR